MSKTNKNKRKKKRKSFRSEILYSQMQSDGYHAFLAGERPSESELDKMTAEYRSTIRKSPLWQQIIRDYGEIKAEEILQECKVEIRP